MIRERTRSSEDDFQSHVKLPLKCWQPARGDGGLCGLNSLKRILPPFSLSFVFAQQVFTCAKSARTKAMAHGLPDRGDGQRRWLEQLTQQWEVDGTHHSGPWPAGRAWLQTPDPIRNQKGARGSAPAASDAGFCGCLAALGSRAQPLGI